MTLGHTQMKLHSILLSYVQNDRLSKTRDGKSTQADYISVYFYCQHLTEVAFHSSPLSKRF